MAVLVLGLLLVLAMAGHSNAAYCVCKQGVGDAVMQKAIDYACGAGADCNPIRPNGQCYNPNTILNHCSYAVNNYYQKKASTGATCDFNGAATLSSSDPSGGSCSYSAGSGSTGTGATGPVTTVPTTSPSTGTTPVNPVSGTGVGVGIGSSPKTGTTTSPYTTSPTANTPSSGVLGGGINTGLGPTGSSMDDSSGIRLKRASSGSILAALVVSSVICLLWN